jgi:hypothetical protein
MAHANAGNSEELLKRKFAQKKFHLPVIGHFADRSVKFNSILEASQATGLHPTMIFEACIGKAFYINAQESYTRVGGFNG